MGIKSELLLILIVLIFIITMQILTEKYTNKIVDLILYDSNIVFKELYSKNENGSINKLKEDWFNVENKLSYYIEHDELEKVTSNLVLLEENAKNKEYEQALSNGREFVYWLNHFKQKDELILKNIL